MSSNYQTTQMDIETGLYNAFQAIQLQTEMNSKNGTNEKITEFSVPLKRLVLPSLPLLPLYISSDETCASVTSSQNKQKDSRNYRNQNIINDMNKRQGKQGYYNDNYFAKLGDYVQYGTDDDYTKHTKYFIYHK